MRLARVTIFQSLLELGALGKRQGTDQIESKAQTIGVGGGVGIAILLAGLEDAELGAAVVLNGSRFEAVDRRPLDHLIVGDQTPGYQTRLRLVFALPQMKVGVLAVKPEHARVLIAHKGCIDCAQGLRELNGAQKPLKESQNFCSRLVEFKTNGAPLLPGDLDRNILDLAVIAHARGIDIVDTESIEGSLGDVAAETLRRHLANDENILIVHHREVLDRKALVEAPVPSFALGVLS